MRSFYLVLARSGVDPAGSYRASLKTSWLYLLAKLLDVGLGQLFALHQMLYPSLDISHIGNGRHD